ncbi:hypothetical protein UVI_02013190 [Ustilaginoidea virens]|nr:hypothetical protein UVI_02013190 [Ustilaginoidea virens]
MLTTAPRLHVRRPSPTTTEFTVTTLPPPRLSLSLLRALLGLARLVLSLVTLLLLYAAWTASPLSAGRSLAARSAAVDAYERSPAGALAAAAAASLPPWLLGPGAALAFYLLARRVHRHESFLVLRGLGVQTSESPASYLAGAATRFIPTEKIQDVFITEAFCGFQVRYYLVVVVEGEEDLVVVFPGLLPRRSIVEEVWRGVRECLYEAPRRDGEQA